jgi:uncharacterized protein YjbI with pentapeptide repeats
MSILLNDSNVIDPDFLNRLSAVLNTGEADFSLLVKVSGLSPKIDFQNVDLSEIDFGLADLTEFNFSGSTLKNCNLAGARFSASMFKGTILDGSTLNLKQLRKLSRYAASLKAITLDKRVSSEDIDLMIQEIELRFDSHFVERLSQDERMYFDLKESLYENFIREASKLDDLRVLEHRMNIILENTIEYYNKNPLFDGKSSLFKRKGPFRKAKKSF